MKKILLFLPMLLLILASCSKEEADQPNELKILNIVIAETAVPNQPEEISVTIGKPTPCHEISDVEITSSGNTVSYNFVVPDLPDGEFCTTVIQEETVTVDFEPSTEGEYTLNFLLNGRLVENRTIVVKS